MLPCQTQSHNATFAVATALVHGFELSRGSAEDLLAEYNAKCVPPWKPNELAHKVNQAMNVTHDKPKGWLLSAQSGTPVSTTGKFIVQKIQAVPESESKLTTIDFLKACFEPDEVVCICNDIICDEEGKGRPASKGTFLKRDEWIDRYHGEDQEDNEDFQEVLEMAEESKDKIVQGVIKYLESKNMDFDDMSRFNRYAQQFSQKLLQLYMNF